MKTSPFILTYVITTGTFTMILILNPTFAVSLILAFVLPKLCGYSQINWLISDIDIGLS